MSRSVNGIPSGTEYTVGLGSSRREAVVTTRSREVYEAFTKRLCKLCAVQIMIAAVEPLKLGGRFPVGTVSLYDKGVALTKRQFLTKPETKMFPFFGVAMPPANGAIQVTSVEDNGFSGQASSLEDESTHVLVQLLELARSNRLRSLSELLD